jgi:lysophospholipase L1-like esterase
LILLVEANPIGRRVEEYGPGSLAALERYNEAVRELALRYGAEYVPLEELYRCDPELRDIDVLLPDGTHFSARAHAAMAQVLGNRIAAVRSAVDPIV